MPVSPAATSLADGEREVLPRSGEACSPPPESLGLPGALPLHIRLLDTYSDAELFEFCALNRDLDIERTARGELLIMAPAGVRTSHLNLQLATQLNQWAKRDGTGWATDSSGGFILPNSAMRAPDAAWVRSRRFDITAGEAPGGFLSLCPDFAIELLSSPAALRATQAKMREYIENGLQLGWLIDPFERRVQVYRPNGEIEILDDPDGVDGDPFLLPGFRLDLRGIW